MERRRNWSVFRILMVTGAAVALVIASGSLGSPLLQAADQGFFEAKSRDRAPRSSEEQLIIDAYKKANRSVVNVSTKAEGFDIFGGVNREGSGSGIIIDASKGLIVTNHHVIAGADVVYVTLADGNSYLVKLIGSDADNDLALLRFQELPAGLVAAEFGDSGMLEVGERVLAIGNPFGLERTLTTGIVSSLGRSIRAESGRIIEGIIQTDAAINPGNSGGPLLDMAGRVVGINTAIVSRTGESSGIGFAIPVNQVKEAIPQLIQYGKVLRPKLGVVISDTDHGPMIFDVQPQTPAAEAGIVGARRIVREGPYEGYVIDASQADFIVAINGSPVQSKAEALRILSRTKPQEEVTLVLRRGLGGRSGRKVTLRTYLG